MNKSVNESKWSERGGCETTTVAKVSVTETVRILSLSLSLSLCVCVCVCVCLCVCDGWMDGRERQNVERVCECV